VEPYGSIVLPILQKEMASGKIVSSATDLLLLLCQFVDGANQVKDRATLYVQSLLPLAQASDNRELLTAVIGGIARVFEKGEGEKQLRDHMQRFLSDLPSALDIVKELYAENEAETTLFGWYWQLLEQRRHSIRLELVELCKNQQDALFFRLFKRGVNRLIEQGEIMGLIRFLEPPVRDSFYRRYFPDMLEAISSASGNRLPDATFVVELSEFFESMGADVPIALLIRQRIKVMDLSHPLSREPAEDELINKWLASNPAEAGLVAKILIVRELRNLPVHLTPEQLWNEDLRAFKERKYELNLFDFQAASQRLLSLFVQSPSEWKSGSWKVVEEMAWRDEREATYFLTLIQGFLQDFRRQRPDDYLDILASGTVRWMRDRETFRLLVGVLSKSYEGLDRKEKDEYKRKVEDLVNRISEERWTDEYPGLEDWEEMIGRKKGGGLMGFLRRPFGPKHKDR